MCEWIIAIPADNKEERWQPIAACKSLENLRALASSLMSDNCDGPLVIRIEKRRVISDQK